MLYIIAGSYKPNIAATQRLLALAKGLSINGVDYRLVFVYPDDKLSTISEKGEFGKICYLWEKHPIKNKYLKYLRSFFDVSRYVSKLPKGSTVLLINANDYLSTVIRYKKRLKVFVEINEHPSMVSLRPSILQKHFIRDCKKVDGMFVISSALKQLFEEMGVKKVETLNMVVDPQRFNNLIKSDSKEKYIAYCGSATNNKDGVDILIKAFATISEQIADYKLYIIGKSPEYNDENSNLLLVEQLGISDKVVFTGAVSSERIPQLLFDAELLVLARPDSIQAKYGFPTKLGEYLLTANPVVVTSVGDIPLFLKDRESAIIAKPDDVQDLTAKMIWFADFPTEASAIGHKGKEVALKCFNAYSESKKIESLIYGKE